MKQVSQNYKDHSIKLDDVQQPIVKPNGCLVKSAYSLISIGTEGMKAREGKMSYVEMARTRPDQVKKVIDVVKQQGIVAAYQKAMNKLDSLTPLGYSLSGIVAAVGREVDEFYVGQRVACAGAGYANHAEVNYIPKNLVVPINDRVSLEEAAFTTVGAIAMQGYRQSNMQLGETACVIGLGLVGQLLAQILVAAGINVVGSDLSNERCEIAMANGAKYAGKPDSPLLLSYIKSITAGNGVDCVFITAGGSSNQPVELAVNVARDRANVVVVGKTKLDLPWNAYYEKELNVIFSRSYGPGRYDTNYEEKGIDYPIGYIRWPEKSNMEAFIRLIDNGSLNLKSIISKVYPFDEAESVFEALAEGKLEGLGVLFKYSDAGSLKSEGKSVNATKKSKSTQKGRSSIGLGLIGVGNYASSMLLPHMKKNSEVSLIAAATQTSLSAKNAENKHSFSWSTTNYQEVLSATDIEAVLIATRHSSHAKLTSEALAAGKAVFVEKPLAINTEELEVVRTTIIQTNNDRLQVGFNRRFSPLILKVADITHKVQVPLVMTYRVHAGQMDADSWYLDKDEGSRFVGEGGHFIDLISFLLASSPVSVVAKRLQSLNMTNDDLDNIVATITYENGSVGNLLYLTQGGAKVPKEYFEIFGCGLAVQLHNFRYADIYEGTSHYRIKNPGLGKGQKEELEAFVSSVKSGEAMPIEIDSLIETTLTTLAVEKSLRENREVALSEYWQQN